MRIGPGLMVALLIGFSLGGVDAKVEPREPLSAAADPVLAVMESYLEGDIARVDLAAALARAQIGIVAGDANPAPIRDTPNVALEDAAAVLAARLGAASIPHEAPTALLPLRDGPGRDAAELLLNAFVPFYDAGLHAQEAGWTLSAWAALLEARADLVDATVQARGILAGGVPTGGAPCAPIRVAPVVALDLDGCDDVYVDDYLFLFDIGGTDLYLNNAGGNRLRTPLGTAPAPAAAAWDWGGNDQYVSRANYGINGGAYAGAGFLYDEWGHDRYEAGTEGLNGGALGGAGLLWDREGDDWMETGFPYPWNEGLGVNGGVIIGAGFLLDEAGNDTHIGHAGGANGGSLHLLSVPGSASGLLVDLEGDDVHTVVPGFCFQDCILDPCLTIPPPLPSPGSSCGNNGGANGGHGLLFDAAGTDQYQDGWQTPRMDETINPKGNLGHQIDHAG